MVREYCLVQFKVLQFEDISALEEEKADRHHNEYVESEKLDKQGIIVTPTVIGKSNSIYYSCCLDHDTSIDNWGDILDNCGFDVISLCVEKVNQSEYSFGVRGCYFLTLWEMEHEEGYEPVHHCLGEVSPHTIYTNGQKAQVVTKAVPVSVIYDRLTRKVLGFSGSAMKNFGSYDWGLCQLRVPEGLNVKGMSLDKLLGNEGASWNDTIGWDEKGKAVRI